MKLFKNKECWHAFLKPIDKAFEVITGPHMKVLVFLALLAAIFVCSTKHIVSHFYDKEKEILQLQYELNHKQTESEVRYSERAWEREQIERRNEAVNERILNSTEDEAVLYYINRTLSAF